MQQMNSVPELIANVLVVAWVEGVAGALTEN